MCFESFIEILKNPILGPLLIGFFQASTVTLSFYPPLDAIRISLQSKMEVFADPPIRSRGIKDFLFFWREIFRQRAFVVVKHSFVMGFTRWTLRGVMWMGVYSCVKSFAQGMCSADSPMLAKFIGTTFTAAAAAASDALFTNITEAPVKHFLTHNRDKALQNMSIWKVYFTQAKRGYFCGYFGTFCKYFTSPFFASICDDVIRNAFTPSSMYENIGIAFVCAIFGVVMSNTFDVVATMKQTGRIDSWGEFFKIFATQDRFIIFRGTAPRSILSAHMLFSVMLIKNLLNS